MELHVCITCNMTFIGFDKSIPYQDHAFSLKLNSPEVPQKHQEAFLAPEQLFHFPINKLPDIFQINVHQ